MTKEYEKRLIELAKETHEVAKALKFDSSNICDARGWTTFICKLNHLFGFIEALEEKKL